MLLTSRCAGCDRPGEVLCRTCRFALMSGGSHARPGESAGVLAALPFTGRARSVVLGLKYRNRRAVARHLAGLLVRRLHADGVRPGIDVDVVTWAPTTRARRRARGFDQAELVARHAARLLGLPCRRLLRREPGDPQTGSTRVERLDGPVFRVGPGATGRRVLVVDDVVTTGTTLVRAAAALLEGGAVEVVRAAVAATPRAEPSGTVLVGPWAAEAMETTIRRSA